MSKDKNKLQDSSFGASQMTNISIPAVDALIGKLLGEQLEEMSRSLNDEQIVQLVNKLFNIKTREEQPIAKAASKKKKKK